MRARTAASLAAEAAFRARLKELGAELLEPEWLGSQQKHRALCRNGHKCNPRPDDVHRGRGICGACAGLDPAVAAAQFRARLAELGAELLQPYVNSKTAHHARCAAGHDCYPRPNDVQQGGGICAVCADRDPAKAEAAFRARLAELGATPLYGEYRSAHGKLHVRCAAGHDSYPTPHDVQKGGGICRTCAGKDPAAAEVAFLARLAELGAVPLYETWLGSGRPHHIRCPAGHECYSRPNDVQQGDGICVTCARHDPRVAEAAFRARLADLGAELLEPYVNNRTPVRVRCAAGHERKPVPGPVIAGVGICRFCAGGEWDAFYVVTGGGVVKFGITTGEGRPRLLTHAADGYTEVVRLVTSLPGTVALDTENAVKSALGLAGEKPLQGREYFDGSCLALILDVADSWLAAAEVPAEIISTALPRAWAQDELFAA